MPWPCLRMRGVQAGHEGDRKGRAGRQERSDEGGGSVIIATGPADLSAHFAAALLFTTVPTDRALDGWCGASWAYEAMAALRVPRERDEEAG